MTSGPNFSIHSIKWVRKITNVKRLFLEARLSPPICLPPASKSCFIKSGELLQACLGNIVPIMNSAKTFSYNRTKLSGFCLCIKLKLHILLLWKLFLFSENDSSSSEQWDSLGISGNDINYFWSAILPGREKDSLSSSQNLTIIPHFKRSIIRKESMGFVLCLIQKNPTHHLWVIKLMMLLVALGPLNLGVADSCGLSFQPTQEFPPNASEHETRTYVNLFLITKVHKCIEDYKYHLKDYISPIKEGFLQTFVDLSPCRKWPNTQENSC